MTTREMAAEYRMSHWAGIIHKRVESGLNVKTFCETEGIHENTYFYWQRKLREAASEKMALPVTQQKKGNNESIPNGWAAVIPIDKGEKSGITIEIGKCKVTATSESNQELLAAVCRTLVAIC